MNIDRDFALTFWDDIYGANNKWQTDCFGTWMYRDDYGDIDKERNNRPNGTGKSYNYGWEIDHIRPKSSFYNENDADFENNLEPMCHRHNHDKADSYPQFTINEKSYTVVKCEICSSHGLRGYGIKDMQTGKRIDWKSIRNTYFS